VGKKWAAKISDQKGWLVGAQAGRDREVFVLYGKERKDLGEKMKGGRRGEEMDSLLS